MLELEGVNAGYELSRVLFDLSMTVGEGEIVSLIGRNGVGKTSTVKAIMGLITTSSGSIRFNETEISRLPVFKRARMGIAYVPDDRGIFVNLTTEENLRLPLIGHTSKGSGGIDFVVELFPILKERWNQRAGTLSGGEQQMLSIARGLVVRPRLLLLDEISEGLAPEIISSCCQVFKTIRTETSILITEQDVRVALEVSDRVYIMLHGSLVFHGSVADVHKEKAIEKYVHL